MQIKSIDESMCVDYYEIKGVNGQIDTQNRLKVLTFMGETMKKRCYKMYGKWQKNLMIIYRIITIK